MNRPLRVCAVSGGRADYGLLTPVLRALRDDPRFELQLILTGQHVTKGPSGTASLVRADGFEISAEIDMQLTGDDPTSVIKGAGYLLEGMADRIGRLKPDLVLVLGDRYEIVCVALAATIAGIPIAHIAGGDVTEGAFDDAFRHAISKMSHLHFVTNEQSGRRIQQLGETPERIHVVGSPGLDRIRSAKIPSRTDFFESIGLPPKSINLIITFHPETLAVNTLAGLDELLAALEQFASEASILFTGSNADPGGREVDLRIESFIAGNPSMRRLDSLGSEKYFAALTYMDAVVGNSSSGLYEAPSFGIPTVNVGDRQTGRLKAESVFDCEAERGAIAAALTSALARGRRQTVNPYGDGHAAERIIDELAKVSEPRTLLKKRFFDLEVV